MLSRGIEALLGPRTRQNKANREGAERVFGSGRPWPITNLPPELLAKIVKSKHLSPNDLARLCRTSKALQPHAQYALYSEAVFVLQDDKEHDHVYFLPPEQRNLLRTLPTCPHLAKLVISFGLRINTSNCPALTAKVFGLSLDGVDYDKYRLPDEFIEPRIVHTKRISFLDLSIVSQIEELEVDSIFLLPSLSNLKHLTGSVPSFDREVTKDDVLAWSEPPVFQSLNPHLPTGTPPVHAIFFAAWLVSSSQESLRTLSIFHPLFHILVKIFTGLHTLNFTVASADEDWVSPTLGEILETLPDSVTSLTIDDWTRFGEEAVPYDKHYLSRLPPSLRRLELSSTPYHPSTVLSLVENVPSALPRLKVLELTGKLDGSFWGTLMRDPSSRWEGKDWKKSEELCRKNGIRCVV
ncbi:hypothetical protein JCM8547_007471 [Rhodosporidiobolus lusitaniae]